MTKKSCRLEIYIAVCLIAALVASAIRTAALFLDFNTETNYFDSKIIINIASVFLAVGALFLFTYAFFSDSKKPLIASFTSPATFVPTTVAVIALVYFAIGAEAKILSFGTTLSEAIEFKNTTYLIWIGLLILSLLSVVYFILNAVVENRASIVRASFGLIAVLFFALYSAHFFFSADLQLNAPNKVVDQLAYLFAALFFLYEIRISLGRECWNLYVAFGFVAAVLLAYSAIPTLIYYVFTGKCVSASIFEIALTFSLFLFVASRLILTSSLVEDKISDTVILIKEASERKSAYLAEKSDADEATDTPEEIDVAPDQSEPAPAVGGAEDGEGYTVEGEGEPSSLPYVPEATDNSGRDTPASSDDTSDTQ